MKKFLLLAILAAFAVAFVACNSDSDDSERRTLVMGTNADFFPFEFLAGEERGVIGRYAGIDVSLAARIAYELDMDIVIQDQEFAGLIVALQNRTIDFIAAGMTIRPDRQEVVNFTVPYFNSGQFIIVQAGNTDINSMADLEGALIGVQLGTTGEFAVSDAQDAGEITFGNINMFNSTTVGVSNLLSGSIDAFIIDAPVARAFLSNHPNDLRIFQDTDFFGLEQFGMAFHQEDTELLAQFNEVLSRLIAEGYVDYLYEYYMREFADMQD